MKTIKDKNSGTSEKTVFISLLIIACYFGPSSTGLSPTASMEDYKRGNDSWSLIKSESGIDLYERLINLPDNPKGRQIYIDFHVDVGASEVVDVIRDANASLTWMTGIKTFRLLRETDMHEWYTYLLYDIPWPLKKQDLVIKYTIQKNTNSQSVRIEMTSHPDLLPPTKGVCRINHIQGTWIITRVSEELTRVQYYIYSAQKSSFPRWLTDPIIQNNLIKTMRNLKDYVQEKNQKNISYQKKPYLKTKMP